MRWFKLLFKWLVFVVYCVLLYLVMYRFPHEKKLPDFYQSQFLSIGSITVVVIAFVLIAVWLRLCDGRHSTVDSYKKKRKEALD